MDATLPVLAGVVSTVIFVSSTLPMLHKALRTRDLGSYSLGNLALANVGNAVYSVYVFSLPPGPLWALHAFHLSSTAFMLVWFLRFEFLPRRGRGSGPTEPRVKQPDPPDPAFRASESGWAVAASEG